jgi:AraC-like DNA-binding protein
MAYRQHAPSAVFRPLVDAYWINQPSASDATPFDRILPDGCIDLVFRGDADGGRLFASALIEEPVILHGGEPAWFAGVRFRPAMMRAVLDVDPADCRDRDTPASLIHAEFAALERRLQGCASPQEALATLKHAVDQRMANGDRRAAPPRVQEAIAALARGGDIRTVARAVGLSERSLHRDLVRWSGLAPKSLARILRMQRCLAALRTGRMPLALLALRLGYADQAHMTRELKALAGVTPREVVRESLVRNLQDAA